MGPSVLLAISQRNMWVAEEDHACTSSGPPVDPWIGRFILSDFPTRGRDPAVCQECSRNNGPGRAEDQNQGKELTVTGAGCNGEKLRDHFSIR